MKVTLKGLRTALDKVCLYLIPLLVIGIPFLLLMSTDNDGKVRLLPNLIPTNPHVRNHGRHSCSGVGELEYADALLRRAEKKAKKAAA